MRYQVVHAFLLWVLLIERLVGRHSPGERVACCELRRVVLFTHANYKHGRREERREGRRRGGNIPCNSLAVAMNVPCATSHSNASKLDAVFVDQCFVQCLLA